MGLTTGARTLVFHLLSGMSDPQAGWLLQASEYPSLVLFPSGPGTPEPRSGWPQTFQLLLWQALPLARHLEDDEEVGNLGPWASEVLSFVADCFGHIWAFGLF